MEPFPKTFEAIGRLCSAWAYLESVTEQTVWGIIGTDANIGRFITWRLDLRSRWQLILEQAPAKHIETDMANLRRINKDVSTIAHDRNIIVHGLIHAVITLPGPKPPMGTVIGPVGKPYDFHRTPCWTVFRGAEAGKNFLVSSRAVELVCANIQKVAEMVVDFNRAKNYSAINPQSVNIEADWPKPLE
jgi:hypothetical protein